MYTYICSFRQSENIFYLNININKNVSITFMFIKSWITIGLYLIFRLNLSILRIRKKMFKTLQISSSFDIFFLIKLILLKKCCSLNLIGLAAHLPPID